MISHNLATVIEDPNFNMQLLRWLEVCCEIQAQTLRDVQASVDIFAKRITSWTATSRKCESFYRRR